MKKGAQHRTKVKKTKPNTLDAFCSVATAFAANERLLFLPAKNLEEMASRVSHRRLGNWNMASEMFLSSGMLHHIVY
jgi:hypothetical protein